MKKLLLLTIGAMLSAGTLNADAKVSLPGFHKEKAQKEHKISAPRKAPAVSKIHPVSAPPKMTIDPNDMVDKSMLTSYKSTTTYEDDNNKYVEEGTFTYDEYGFLKTVTLSNGAVQTYEYQWQVPGRVWSSRSVTVYDNTTTTTRTFHPNGMVATETEGSNFKAYDENGYLIEVKYVYDTNTDWYKYHYFAPTGEWFYSEIHDYNKREYTIEDNAVILSEMQKMSDGKWYYQSVYIRYFNDRGEECGNMQKYYLCNDGEENIVISANGSRSSSYTEDGKSIYRSENYNSETDKWECSYMTIKSANYDDPYIYKPGEVRFEENYYNDINEDGIIDSNDLGEKRVVTWVKDRIMKVEYSDYRYDEYVTYYRLADEDGQDYRSIYYNTSNGSYCTNHWSEDEDCEYYTFFDANHKELETFRALEQNNAPDTWEKKNGNAWEKCTGTVTVWSGSDDKYVITFDAQGRMIRYEEWEYDEFDEYSTYAYDADGNGWTRTDCRSYENSSTGAVEMKKTGESGYRTLADGSIEDWYIDYDDNAYGRKNIIYSNGTIKNYEYRSGEWYFYGWSVDSKETMLENGYIETIYYSIDNNGVISNSNKEIGKHVYEENYEFNHYETYYWDSQSSAWIGERKEISWHRGMENEREEYAWSFDTNNWYPISKYVEKISGFPDIEYIAPVDPLVINDEYFFETEKYPNSESTSMIVKGYQWDDESKDLKLSFAYGVEYAKISDKEVRITDYNDIWNGIKIYSFKLDDQRRVVEYKDETWAYNDNNQVVEHLIKSDYSLQHYEYTYSDIKVWNGIEDIAGEDATVIATYNLAGVAVDTDNLTAGIYIQKLSNGTSRKIVVK